MPVWYRSLCCHGDDQQQEASPWHAQQTPIFRCQRTVLRKFHKNPVHHAVCLLTWSICCTVPNLLVSRKAFVSQSIVCTTQTQLIFQVPRHQDSSLVSLTLCFLPSKKLVMPDYHTWWCIPVRNSPLQLALEPRCTRALWVGPGAHGTPLVRRGVWRWSCVAWSIDHLQLNLPQWIWTPHQNTLCSWARGEALQLLAIAECQVQCST